MDGHQEWTAVRTIAFLRRVTGLDAVMRLLDRARGVTRQRELDAQLAEARAQIDELRAQLAEATRPPTQFARMHVRGVAVDRLVRLRLAAPSRSRSRSSAEARRDAGARTPSG